jgi:hypothetical protein
VPFLCQFRYNISVPSFDHFIQEEIISCHFHVPDHRDIAAEPNIRLLADRGIETPVAILVNKFGESGGIAV